MFLQSLGFFFFSVRCTRTSTLILSSSLSRVGAGSSGTATASPGELHYPLRGIRHHLRQAPSEVCYGDVGEGKKFSFFFFKIFVAFCVSESPARRNLQCRHDGPEANLPRWSEGLRPLLQRFSV
jgi:hypothetical protein